MSRMRLTVVGAFLVGGIVLFSAGLFMIGDRRLLFSKQFELQTTLGKVTGLQAGSKVRFAGMDAGEVLAILIPSRPSEQFLVRMRVRDDVRHLIRADSVCAVQTDGIVGSTFLQISRGTDAAAMVGPGDTLTGNDPVEFADLIQEGRETFRTVSREIVDLKDNASDAITALAETVRSTNGLIVDVDQGFQTLTASSVGVVEDLHVVVDDVRGAIANAKQVVDDVKAGQGTIGQLLTDDALYQRLTGIGQQTEAALGNLRDMTERGKGILDGFTASNGTGQRISQSLQDTLTQAEEVMSDMAEGAEALKRNFLFRGFFRQRGFYDLDALSREAYARGALEGKDRTALRIWIDASVLFTRDAAGMEQLTEAGKRRLDAAMADFVRYPRDSPLVVEGYASAAGGQLAYVVSADRGELVRDYLRSRYRRKSTLLDFMPMGEQAVNSPSANRQWSGVALALFVRHDALERAGAAAGQP